MGCGAAIECLCIDGTMQEGGCPNGFTCLGSLEYEAPDAGDG